MEETRIISSPSDQRNELAEKCLQFYPDLMRRALLLTRDEDRARDLVQ